MARPVGGENSFLNQLHINVGGYQLKAGQFEVKPFVVSPSINSGEPCRTMNGLIAHPSTGSERTVKPSACPALSW
jgi:hypothetical protein